MAENDAEKTEDPTAKKLKEAHERGQFAKSEEVQTALIVAATFTVIAFAGRDKITMLSDFSRATFSHIGEMELTVESVTKGVREAFSLIFLVMLPLMMGVCVAAITAGGLQSGFKLTPKTLEAKIDKLSPLKGAKQLFNKRKFIQLAVDLVKFAAMFSILYGLIRNTMNDPIFSAPVPIQYVGEFLFKLFMEMLSRLVLVLIVVAAIDYFWQRWKTREELKMSKQEVKDEHKQQEGDPLVKGQRRQFALRLLQQRMAHEVPNADVVVTNPTHYAVALKYEQGVDNAPIVLAKGEGRFAKRLKEIAREHGVPMVENRPVARLLYKTGNIGKPIPLELYQVVAQILAHVYRSHRYYFHRLRIRRLAERQNAAPAATPAA